MKEIKLNVKDIPSGYALCFNSDCADKDKCLHYQAKLLMADRCYKGQAVYPAAWQDGKCCCYNEKKLVQKAWGFSQTLSRPISATISRRVCTVWSSITRQSSFVVFPPETSERPT